MGNAISGVWRAVVSRLVVEDAPLLEPVETDLAQLVDQARRDWLAARAYFEEVTDPALVDHAIYLLEATEKKYMYLLSLARQGDARTDASGQVAAAAPRRLRAGPW